MHSWLIFAHIGGVLLLTAATGASVCAKVAARSVDHPREVLALYRLAAGAVRLLALPAIILILAAGIGLVHESDGAYTFGQPWVGGVLVLLVLSGLIGGMLHGPRSRRVRTHAAALAERGADVDEQLRVAMRAGVLPSVLDVLVLVAMFALMVFKPGL